MTSGVVSSNISPSGHSGKTIQSAYHVVNKADNKISANNTSQIGIKLKLV